MNFFIIGCWVNTFSIFLLLHRWYNEWKRTVTKKED